MNRAFVSLYVLLVFSVVAVGWGTDKLWQVFNPAGEIEPFEQEFFAILEFELAAVPDEKIFERVVELNQELELHIDIYALDEFAQSSIAQDIAGGGLVALFDEQGGRQIYKQLAQRDWVVRVIKPSEIAPNYALYKNAFLIFFYLAIAVVVYFWVWPLSRDMRTLEMQTKNVGRDGVVDTVNLAPSSNVWSLANAFNVMANRVKELIHSHREMTYAVSHELRTPLARMKFALTMASETEDKTKLREHLASVREDVSDMDALVNQLLTYAGFEHGDPRLNFQQGDLMALAENVVANLSPLQPNIAVSIHNELTSEPRCEWVLMERALHNLIQNGLRYGTSNLHITLSQTQQYYSVVVEDDGSGVPEDERARVFEAFVRLQATGAPKQSGFGLGLAIVKRIAHWHKGEVVVTESQWGGAKFTFTWPVTGF